MLMQRDQLLFWNIQKFEQLARVPRIFASDNINILKCLNRPLCYITDISDRRRNNKQSSHISPTKLRIFISVQSAGSISVVSTLSVRKYASIFSDNMLF